MMSRWVAIWGIGLAVLGGCKQPAATVTGSAGSAGSAAAGSAAAQGSAAGSAAAGSAAGSGAPVGGLVLESEDTGEGASALALAFAGKVPRLPAISADGRVLAQLTSPASGPMDPAPLLVELRAVSAERVLETLPILPEDEATPLAERTGGDDWRTPALRARLRERAAAVLARLRGFRSLESVALNGDGTGTLKPTPIDGLTLVPSTVADDTLVLELHDARGAALQHVELEAYTTREGDNVCGYQPRLNDAHVDRPTRTLYLFAGFRYRDDCDRPRAPIFVWSLDPARADPLAVIGGLVRAQLDLVGVNATRAEDIVVPAAPIVTTGELGSVADVHAIGVATRAMDYSGSTASAVDVTVARDGKSAWASAALSVSLLERDTPGRAAPWRASDVLVRTPAGWRIAAMAWTEPRANAVVNRDAKAGKLTVPKLAADPGDAALRDAFAKLTTAGVDPAAAARADLVAFGSGPGERTVGGAAFARAWNAAWKGKVTIASSVARLLPSATTGWVAATVELAKPGYKVPFTVFAVFDKLADGTWSLVHIHFAA